MAQVDSAPDQTFSPRDVRFFRLALLIPIGTIALIVTVAIVSVFVARPTAGPATEVRAQVGEATDGWMAGVTAANRAARLEEARRVQDGWSAYLLRPEPAITDGWASYLLVDEPPIVDGWATRYLVPDGDER